MITADSPVKRKLFFVWNYTNWGGAQIYLLGIIKYAKGEWDVRVVLPVGSSPDLLRFIEDVGVPYDFINAEVDMGEATTIRRRLVRQKSRILAEIRTFRFLCKLDLDSSVIHLEFAPWQSWIFYTALSLIGANVFVNMHNALPVVPLWRRLIWRFRLHFVSRLPGFHLLTSNHDTRSKLRGWVNDEFWKNIKVAYTSIDVSEISSACEARFDKQLTLDKHQIPRSRLIVLCVAQFIDRKGRWTFLDAAKMVASSSSDISFVWVAPSAPERDEQARINAYGLGQQFRLIESHDVGPSRIDILKFFKIADIFVLPSLVEGLPGSLLEAMALGLPVISTNINAIPEAIEDGKTGILIEPADPLALVGALTKLIANDDLRRSLAGAGQKFVIENFDQKSTSCLVTNEYRECFDRAS